MKKLIMTIIFLALASCEGVCDGENAKSCGYACGHAGHAMIRWSRTEGCICSEGK